MRDGIGGIEVNICCGSVSMSNTKCLVVTILILNIMAFCILLALLIDIYIEKVQNLESITKRGELKFFHITLQLLPHFPKKMLPNSLWTDMTNIILNI